MSTKHHIDPKDVERLSVGHSAPTYSGNGANHVGSTTVTLTFTLLDGTAVTETETFSNIKETTIRNVNYTIGAYDVAVKVIVTTEGKNNQMSITGATAEITNKVDNH